MIKNQYKVKSGIGWDDDLKIALHSTQDKWYPQIQSGYFYLAGQEDYLFAEEGWKHITANIGITTSTDISNLKIPSISGPIIVDGEIERYTRCSSNFVAFSPITPSTGSSDLLYLTIPGLLTVLTGSNGIDMISVPGTGFLTERNYYYFDTISRIAYISRNSTDINRSETLFASYLKDNASLLQEEILLVDRDGLVRVMFDRVSFGASGTIYNPTIYKIGTGTISVSGVDKNTLYPTTVLSENDRVSVKYYIDKSFTITDSSSGDGTDIQLFSNTLDYVNLRWEQADKDSFLDIGRFDITSLSHIQLNSAYNNIYQGFLWLSKPFCPAEYLDSLNIRVSQNILSNKLRQTLRIIVDCKDVNNLPIANIPVRCWINTPASTGVTTYVPIRTDLNYLNRSGLTGQAQYSWSVQPEFHGTFTIYASAITAAGSSIIVSKTIEVLDSPVYSDIINSAKVYMYLSPNKDSEGFNDLYLYLTTQSGIPFPSNLKIKIKCILGRLFYNKTVVSSGFNIGSKELVVTFNTDTRLDGFRTTTCRYIPAIGDIIIATPEDNKDDSSNPILSTYKFESIPLEINQI